MQTFPLHLLLFATLITLAVNAEKFAYQNDPSLPPITLSEKEMKRLKPVHDPKAPAPPLEKRGYVIPGKLLFARQQCRQTCRDTGNCVDDSRICCRGYQCYAQNRCCNGGCISPGEDCCGSGGYCPVGERCMIWLETGQPFCDPIGGSSSTTETEEEEPDFTTTWTSWSTRTTRTRTLYTSTSTSTPECRDSGYDLCPDERFCCPSSAICYYDTHNVPRCWDGSTNYYTYRWYYSWSYSFGVRWYVTTTSIYITRDYSNVLTLDAPTPTTPPPTTETVDPPKTTTKEFSTATAEALSGGSPPDPEDSVASLEGDETSPTTSDQFKTPEETAGGGIASAADGLRLGAGGRCGYMLGALAVVALGAAMA